MLKAGDTFWFTPLPSPEHLYFVLMNPDSGGKIIIVNATDAEKEKDDATELDVGEHEKITKPSRINNRRALYLRTRLLESYLQDGTVRADSPCSTELLNKLQRGFLKSKRAKKKFQAILSQQLSN